MARLHRQRGLVLVAALGLGLGLAGCGGGGDSAAVESAPVETEAVTAPETEVAEETETETDAEERSGGTDDGAVPAPGTGRLVLDDGRAFAITVTECKFQPAGTFTVEGTGDDGATFEMTQFFLNDEWSQSQVELQFPNSDSVYVIVSRATEGAEPATVEGKSVSWTQTFRELDESANRHVYTGEGTVRVTCA